ncbi:hypothetical protein HYH03_011549 [Edaphochlamys debaryana]|uniref:Uncharacterized protein n=1 Tax=Edaphochlamys debaryana TaxID=47281 RepID=A0A836BVC8_9CHLO|nr:hypothetical protein HYH03_011549 [Edaphochlamys debaryana]|eukprot:KAG2489912.1 hypothetical protein HYH03_011549 [Edaphochlamys debaryana]
MNSLAASRLPAVPEDRPLNAAALHAPRGGRTREKPRRRPAAKAPPPSRLATLLPTALAALALAVSVAAVAVSVGSRREARGMEARLVDCLTARLEARLVDRLTARLEARLVDRLTAVLDERLSAMEASSSVRAPHRRQ